MFALTAVLHCEYGTSSRHCLACPVLHDRRVSDGGAQRFHVDALFRSCDTMKYPDTRPQPRPAAGHVPAWAARPLLKGFASMPLFRELQEMQALTARETQIRDRLLALPMEAAAVPGGGLGQTTFSGASPVRQSHERSSV